MKIAEYLKHCWEKMFGIHVILNKSDWKTFHANLLSFNFTMAGIARHTSFEDPICFLEYFLFADRNYSKWENPEFKNWVDLANAAVSEKNRSKYLHKAEEILKEDIPVICLYTHKHLYLCNPLLKNFSPGRLIYCDFRWAYFEK